MSWPGVVTAAIERIFCIRFGLKAEGAVLSRCSMNAGFAGGVVAVLGGGSWTWHALRSLEDTAREERARIANAGGRLVAAHAPAPAVMQLVDRAPDAVARTQGSALATVAKDDFEVRGGHRQHCHRTPPRRLDSAPSSVSLSAA